MIIGIYDSGLGGLTVWRELRKLGASLVYFGDTANVPYGEKTSEQLVGYFWDVHSFMHKQGCDLIVVACNTASALAVPEVEKKNTLPIFGIIEAAVSGCLRVSSGRLGILATPATVASGVYQRAFLQARPTWQTFVASAPKLASLIEAGQANELVTKDIVAEYLAPLQKQKIDTLLLGCTHYPLVRPLFSEILGPTVQLVDPAPILAEQVAKLITSQPAVTGTEFWVSANPEQFQTIAQDLLGENLSVVGLYHLPGEKLS